MRLVASRIPVLLFGAALTLAPGAHGEGTRTRIDHVILGISDLEKGVRQFEKLTGVEAVLGGEHPGVGTHNALVALGQGTYIELIAPQLSAEPQGRWSGLVDLQELSPVGWATGTDDLRQLLEAIRRAGFKTTVPAGGSRVRPDGLTLEWKTADIAEPTVPQAPFFIEWSKTSAHPSTTSPKGCRLEALEIHNPKPVLLARLVKELGLEVRIVEGPEPTMVVALECPRGRVVFGGR